ncbi:cobalamin-dependent protein [Candidatus Venteria ishoeyi]|uniref:cobalamin B12-binding domain-containing protein n=1 Tax=Candidatus Venteria ishoeyi TaxID=1899563 RepID=UPI0025A53C48|nr:cobalamin-dependent protein [Candidatus Venteria ishoeyi]MDM8545995.1 cobalamin-dependent protein [Candidatus Venteria ishoeyi]
MPDYIRIADEMKAALLATDRLQAEDILTELTAQPILDVVEGVVVPAMENIGNDWEAGNVALSQVYMSARICEELVDSVLAPPGRLRNPQPNIGIVVLEDYHFLGKRIIHSILRATGYDIIDLGHLDADALIEQVEVDKIEVLLISTLMLRSALRITYVREQLQQRGLEVYLIVGGAPFRFDSQLWQEVGADATASGAEDLLPLFMEIIKGKVS